MSGKIITFGLVLSAFLCLESGLTGSVQAGGLVDLPQTGQIWAYGSSPGQDGDIQAGVAWPDPRFTDNGDGTVTDNLTGLMWLKDAYCFPFKTWQAALTAVAGFNVSPGDYMCRGYTASYSDWVVPNVNELESLVHANESRPYSWLNSQGFSTVQASYYWTSTSYAASPSDTGWAVDFSDGSVLRDYKPFEEFVWPVRSAD